MPANELDRLLVAQIRRGEPGAWDECIARFEGRLQAFVESRLGNRATSEDVVQETFLGFLISLPNYDDATPLESFLFSIAAHKLTDVLRRNGAEWLHGLITKAVAKWSDSATARALNSCGRRSTKSHSR